MKLSYWTKFRIGLIIWIARNVVRVPIDVRFFEFPEYQKAYDQRGVSSERFLNQRTPADQREC